MSHGYMYIQMDQQQMQSKMVEQVALSSYRGGGGGGANNWELYGNWEALHQLCCIC